MTKIPVALVILVGALAVPGSALAYTGLCASVPSYCTHTDQNAPELRADVCFSTTTGATLKGASDCPMNTRAYVVEHGLVDPLTGFVSAFVPLDDPCSTPGICVAPPKGHNPGWTSPICCKDETCWEWDGGGCIGILYFCHDGVSNEDGTVTCFESEEI